MNSVMEFHPKLVLLTCLFLAAKSENFFISINSFSKRIPKTTPESILSLEFEILQSLQFSLMVHHPYRPLYGFFFDFQNILKDDVPVKELGKIYDAARNLVNDALITDAVYLYTPPQIALACFRETSKETTDLYLKKKFGNASTQFLQLEELVTLIEECQELIRTAADPTKEEAVSIDKKVQYCINPSLTLKRKRPEGSVDDEEASKKQKVEAT